MINNLDKYFSDKVGTDFYRQINNVDDVNHLFIH